MQLVPEYSVCVFCETDPPQAHAAEILLRALAVSVHDRDPSFLIGLLLDFRELWYPMRKIIQSHDNCRETQLCEQHYYVHS